MNILIKKSVLLLLLLPLASCAEIKDTGRAIGDGTVKVAKKIGQSTKEAAKAVGEKTDEVIKDFNADDKAGPKSDGKTKDKTEEDQSGQ